MRISFSENIRVDFMQEAVRLNRMLLRVVCGGSILVELFNIVRVLFFSNSGLSTLNNRLYFGFYVFLAVSCAVFLLTDLLAKLSTRQRYYLHMTAASVVVLWQTVFNIYDIYRSSAVGNITVVTSLVAFSSLVTMRPVYAMCNLWGNYLLFVLSLWRVGSSGEVINFTITAILCAAVYVVRYCHLCTELRQKREIQHMNQELEESRHQFQLSLEQYELIRENEQFVTFEWDIRNRWMRMSKGWEEMFGFPGLIQEFEAFIGTLTELTDEQRREILDCLENVRSGVEHQKLELCLPLKSGGRRWFEVTVIAQADQNGEPAFAIGMLTDIMDKKARLFRLEREVKMDTFTGTFNKAAIETYGERKLQELGSGERLAMFILDMDDFKHINDTYGHPAGDQILKLVADLLWDAAPTGARVGRVGGDEFVVLFVVGDGTDVRRYAEAVVSRVPALQYRGAGVGAGCSIGIALSPAGGSYAQLYETADRALYEAKKRGGNQVFQLGRSLTSAHT